MPFSQEPAKINVKLSERRDLHFDSLAEVLADAEATAAASPRTTGNWSAGQVYHHVAFGIEMMSKGVDVPVTLRMKVFGRGLRLFGMHVKPIDPGINPPAKVAAVFRPPDDVTLEAGLQKLRDEIAYAQEHGLTHPSPLFGRMSADDAVAMQCRHAELHFSFVHPGSGGAAGEADPAA
ncbi:MAG: DUF1569 domain-containing protein [Planctomycetota bacterium]